jgi:hypothetical protein
MRSAYSLTPAPETCSKERQAMYRPPPKSFFDYEDWLAMHTARHHGPRRWVATKYNRALPTARDGLHPRQMHSQRPAAHAQLFDRLGRLLIAWGRRLRARYGDLAGRQDG